MLISPNNISTYPTPRDFSLEKSPVEVETSRTHPILFVWWRKVEENCKLLWVIQTVHFGDSRENNSCNIIQDRYIKLLDSVKEKLTRFYNFQFFFQFSQHYLQCLRSGYSKFQLNQASSFEVIALDSRASEKIDLYSNHTENKLQPLTFAAITLVCICLQCWDFA